MLATVPRFNDPKAPDEQEFYTLDFKKWLGAGETISTSNATIDFPSPSSLIVSGVVTLGTAVRAFLTGGTPGLEYLLTFHIVTSAGQVIKQPTHVPVRDVLR